ncbi:28S ribosomal protein S7, mitochondrial isoform X2 [Alligator sinensis]|uniref:Small ribosomal subunit protein uS7m n=1 Tax=Alligator sinensis TaxID=38654 RepID=A0A1U7RHU0_ALLSI|nr:28S ribosomal protein S7, mitochondrial isoform X1 [Alligator sinensis]XP_025053279.1 28S ribosomal protein S7, mitochondrial isoform X2 [Alligator sinensis]
MAAPALGVLRAARGAWLPGLIQVRWSRYAPAFLEPEVNKETLRKALTELSKEEREQWEFKTTHPIKAAPSSVTSSVFSDPLISKFINMMMKHGNKILARNIMMQTLEAIKRKQMKKYHEASEEEKVNIECNPYTIFHQAVNNCKPIIGLGKIKRGGKVYQIPTPIKENHQRFLAMKWLITECRENKHYRTFMPEKLSQELLLAFHNDGPVIKKKQNLHKMAEGNRAYAHFRWG